MARQNQRIEKQYQTVNDFIATIRQSPRGPWPKFSREVDAAILRWASNKLDTHVLVRFMRVSPHRSERAHRLYRLRNAILAAALDTNADDLHDYIKERLSMVESVTIAGRTFERLRSQKSFTIEEMSAMMAEQDELAAFANIDREVQNYLILPTTEDK